MNKMGQLSFFQKAEILKPINYRVIASLAWGDDRQYQIRQYEPCKRTIFVAGRSYFLQFPYCIFSIYKDFHRSRLLAMAFSVKEFTSEEEWHEFLYYPTLPHISLPPSFGICNAGIECLTYEDCVAAFWQSSFASHTYNGSVCLENLRMTFGSMHEWQDLSLSDVFERLAKAPPEIPQKCFSRCENYPRRCSLREFMSRYANVRV